MTLWLLAILTIFAVGVGHRMSLEIRLSEYQLDRLKLLNMCVSAIQRIISEKENELKSAMSDKVDALSEDWSNNPEIFKDYSFGDGKFSIRYDLMENTEDSVSLYGMSDECSRININKASVQILKNLVQPHLENEDSALKLAGAIIDWRDENKDPSIVNGIFVGCEDYAAEGLLYECKNRRFESIEELLFVAGMDDKIFERIKNFVTVYGDGKININTAPYDVLNAVFSDKFPDLAGKIIAYRKGTDEISGTDDDRWFVKGSLVIDREEKGLVETKNLDGPVTQDPYFALTNQEWDALRKSSSGESLVLKVNSDTFRANVFGSIRNFTKNVVCVIKIKLNEPTEILYWNED